MKHPFFSIIVSTYNRKDQLLLCIQAIFNQSFTDFEVIVVDDCSTDDTLNVLESYKASNFSYFKTKHNTGGPATPRNLGLKNAKGQWVCFCDSDDYFKPEHLKTMYQFIIEQKLKESIITANASLIINYKETDRLFFTGLKQSFQKISLLQNWKSSHSILSSLCICNKNIIPFNEHNDVRSIEDYIFLIENMLAGKSHFLINKATIYYTSDSTDSIRYNFIAHGRKLYKYKFKIYSTNKLWRRSNGVGLGCIIVLDYFKFFIKKLLLKG